jgi:hypothetical protein
MNNILNNSLQLSKLFEIQYYNFWKHIYYDDSYILYKEAILFYKNNKMENIIIFLVD